MRQRLLVALDHDVVTLAVMDAGADVERRGRVARERAHDQLVDGASEDRDLEDRAVAAADDVTDRQPRPGAAELADALPADGADDAPSLGRQVGPQPDVVAARNAGERAGRDRGPHRAAVDVTQVVREVDRQAAHGDADQVQARGVLGLELGGEVAADGAAGVAQQAEGSGPRQLEHGERGADGVPACSGPTRCPRPRLGRTFSKSGTLTM